MGGTFEREAIPGDRVGRPPQNLAHAHAEQTDGQVPPGFLEGPTIVAQRIVVARSREADRALVFVEDRHPWRSTSPAMPWFLAPNTLSGSRASLMPFCARKAPSE